MLPCGQYGTSLSIGIFQDSDFAGDLEDSKSTSGRILCIFGCRTFVPTSWMCKKQTSAPHSSTESEVISLDAGLPMDGIPALDLWDLLIEVLHSSRNQPEQEDLLRDTKTKRHGNPENMHVVTSAKPSHFGAVLAVLRTMK